MKKVVFLFFMLIISCQTKLPSNKLAEQLSNVDCWQKAIIVFKCIENEIPILYFNTNIELYSKLYSAGRVNKNHDFEEMLNESIGSFSNSELGRNKDYFIRAEFVTSLLQDSIQHYFENDMWLKKQYNNEKYIPSLHWLAYESGKRLEFGDLLGSYRIMESIELDKQIIDCRSSLEKINQKK